MVSRRKARGKWEDRRTLGRQGEAALFPAAPPRAGLPSDYGAVLDEIKRRIQQERLRVVMAANSAMVLLYWDIGQLILQRQDHAGWGARVIDRLAKDLRDAFPDTRGFSPRNLKYMRAFAAAWPDRAIVQRVVAQLPWRQNLALIERLDNPKTRLWYAEQAIQNGWSQPIRNNHFLVLVGPRSGQVHFIDANPQGTPIQMGESLFKSLHLKLPLAFCDQWPRTDDWNGTNIAPRLQFAENQACLLSLLFLQS